MGFDVTSGDHAFDWRVRILDGCGNPDSLADVVSAKIAVYIRYTDGTWRETEIDAVKSATPGVLDVNQNGAAVFMGAKPGEYRAQVRLYKAGSALEQVQPPIVLRVRRPYGGYGPRNA